MIGPTIASSLMNRRLCHNNTNNNNINETTTHESNDDKDIEKLFLDSTVQTILQRLTGFDANKIFKCKQLLNKSSPQYKFMSDIELQMVSIL